MPGVGPVEHQGHDEDVLSPVAVDRLDDTRVGYVDGGVGL